MSFSFTVWEKSQKTFVHAHEINSTREFAAPKWHEALSASCHREKSFLRFTAEKKNENAAIFANFHIFTIATTGEDLQSAIRRPTLSSAESISGIWHRQHKNAQQSWRGKCGNARIIFFIVAVAKLQKKSFFLDFSFRGQNFIHPRLCL